eukprot:374435-Pyramimonas_sp.AAC.1
MAPAAVTYPFLGRRGGRRIRGRVYPRVLRVYPRGRLRVYPRVLRVRPRVSWVGADPGAGRLVRGRLGIEHIIGLF